MIGMDIPDLPGSWLCSDRNSRASSPSAEGQLVRFFDTYYKRNCYASLPPFRQYQPAISSVR
jgi:hypothetical protein